MRVLKQMMNPEKQLLLKYILLIFGPVVQSSVFARCLRGLLDRGSEDKEETIIRMSTQMKTNLDELRIRQKRGMNESKGDEKRITGS